MNYLQDSIVKFFSDATESILSVSYPEKKVKVEAVATGYGVEVFLKIGNGHWSTRWSNSFIVSWPEALSLFIGDSSSGSLVTWIQETMQGSEGA